MPILDGPMTIDQMKAWAENTVSKLDIDKCCELRRLLAMSDPPRAKARLQAGRVNR